MGLSSSWTRNHIRATPSLPSLLTCINVSLSLLSLLSRGENSSQQSVSRNSITPFVDGLFLDLCGKNELTIANTRRSRAAWNRAQDEHGGPDESAKIDEAALSRKAADDDGVGSPPVAKNRIVNGTRAKSGQFPSYVYVQWRANENFWSTCGGTLISRDLVLTAAHCVPSLRFSPQTDTSITAGYVDSRDNLQTGRVARACIHKLYQPSRTGLAHDLALLKLSQPFTMNKFVQPACLLVDKAHQPHEVAYTAGLGHTGPAETPAKYLSYIALDRCRSRDHGTNACYRAQTMSNICSGDSGSGVYVMQQGRQYLAAVTSSKTVTPGIAPCDGHYTREASYVDIYLERQEIIGMLNFCFERN